MNDSLKVRYIELKSKRECLIELRAELKKIKKELISNSLAESNRQDQVLELERKLNRNFIRKLFSKESDQRLSDELALIRMKLAQAKERSQASFERSKEIEVELPNLEDAEAEYDRHILNICAKLPNELDRHKSTKLETLATTRQAAANALRLGKEIDKALEEITEKLWEATQAGFVDIIGIPLLGETLKYSRLDSSKNHLDMIKESIDEYASELEKLRIEVKIPSEINISRAQKFSDYFLDGIIFDSMVHHKINAMMDQYNLLQKRIRTIQESLPDIIRENRAVIDSLQTQVLELANFHN